MADVDTQLDPERNDGPAQWTLCPVSSHQVLCCPDLEEADKGTISKKEEKELRVRPRAMAAH
ncbi:unnamed protein product [Nezara viridula]|uniref:Uncharacterized protein n=1 Tax=Nezara viridula TaxID=85310 RepID=A0A9P0HLB8_NEZVI|nr:unnamed protein product [Nezara viridula]